MPFAAALSTSPDTTQAVEETCAQALPKLGGPPDLALVFFSPHHGGAAAELTAALHAKLDAACLLGCQGEAIAGNGREVENDPALSLSSPSKNSLLQEWSRSTPSLKPSCTRCVHAKNQKPTAALAARLWNWQLA